MLTTSCPQCSQPLQAAEELVGKAIKCTCGHAFVLHLPPDPPPLIKRRGARASPFVRRLWPRIPL
jgi:hypothetical protein